MTELEEITKLAAMGEGLPEGLDPAETFLFLAMRNLYSFAKREGMPKEQGTKEKNEILKRYEQLKLWIRLAEEHYRKEREYAEAFETFAKEPTWENADALHRAWFRCGLKTPEPKPDENDGLDGLD